MFFIVPVKLGVGSSVAQHVGAVLHLSPVPHVHTSQCGADLDFVRVFTVCFLQVHGWSCLPRYLPIRALGFWFDLCV